MLKQRLVKIVAKGNNSGINRVLDEQSDQHELITEVDESGGGGGGGGSGIATDDDDGGDSITYVEDYEIAGNSDDTDGDAFFVEYVTEDDDNLVNAASSAATTAAGIASGDSNDSEIDGQSAEYDDDGGGGGGGGGDEMAVELYNCSSCGMNFKSVTEHIQKHHPDQDVLIDISDENGATAIKTERTLDLNDDDDDDIDLNGDNGGSGASDDDEDVGGGTFITSDAVGMVDGEFIVYGGDDESLEEDELIDDALDETDVYTIDDVTGQLTRATSVKSVGKQAATKLGNVSKSTVSIGDISCRRTFNNSVCKIFSVCIFFCIFIL